MNKIKLHNSVQPIDTLIGYVHAEECWHEDIVFASHSYASKEQKMYGQQKHCNS